ncbi:MAG TPA: hypothetical protein VN699_02780, partial [Pirellulales bacterium]|nr:hypothetical protein [Pirellulales bacterium]
SRSGNVFVRHRRVPLGLIMALSAFAGAKARLFAPAKSDSDDAAAQHPSQSRSSLRSRFSPISSLWQAA